MQRIWKFKQVIHSNQSIPGDEPQELNYTNSECMVTYIYLRKLYFGVGTRGSVVGSGTMVQARRSPFRVPDDVEFFNLRNPSSRTRALGSTQPLTEMNIRNFLGGEKEAGA
jgi:hypothetical protein